MTLSENNFQLESELKIFKDSYNVLKQENSQLQKLNSDLVGKLNNYEDHEATVLDKHLEYDRILEGFDKICQKFSDINDSSLGNLSVRGATKKMLMNLQQFAYEQIAGLKINYTFKLESIKESFAEELEFLQESLAQTSLYLNQIKIQEAIIEEQKDKEDNQSEKIIEELERQLHLEIEKKNIIEAKLKSIEYELSNKNRDFDELTLKFEKQKEKLDRETDIKLGLKERLDEIENKYQNISISSLHSKIASLKSQLDLLKLEDAKKIYEKDRKLK